MRKAAIILGVGPTAKDAEAMDRRESPMTEFLAVQRRLGADVISYRSSIEPRTKLFAKAPLRIKLLLPVLYFLFHRNAYGAVYCTGEDIGLPLAFLLRFTNWRGRVVCVVHAATTPRSWAMLRAVKPALFAKLICVSEAQCALIAKNTGFQNDQLKACVNWVDTAFFRPLPEPAPGRYIFACGSENRDYPTLFKALATSTVPAKVVTSGFHGALSGKDTSALQPPETVEILSKLPFTELAALYRESRFVVVPLNPVNYAAGVTGLVEAMASGKAIIATASPGLKEYLEDGISGYVVPPGDPEALRAAIERLWSDPEATERMGRRNRQWIVSEGDVHAYAQMVAGVMQGDAVQSRRDVASSCA